MRLRVIRRDRDTAGDTVRCGEDPCHVCMLDDPGTAGAHAPYECCLDLKSGAVTTCMQDARTRVRGLLRKQQFAILRIECDAPVDQLADARRALLDKHTNGFGTAQSTTRGHGVLVVQLG